MSSTLRVVLDTNVYISGLVFGGPPRAILLLALAGRFTLCISQPIQTEIQRTLAVKFSWTPDQIVRACKPYWDIAEQAPPSQALAVITADPDDDRILECSVDGQADIIVTGDDHLLSLTASQKRPPLGHIRIMTPRRFLDEYLL